MFNPDQLHHIARAASNRQKGTVVLEDVEQDSAYRILKLCDTFGIQNVHMIFQDIKEYDPAKIAEGEDFYNPARWLDIETYTSTEDCLEKLKKKEYKILLPIFGKGGTEIYATTLKEENVAVILADEERGASQKAQGFADERISIKRGGVTEKLGTPLLAGIFLYELTRQRVLYGMDDYLLSTEEEDEIRRRFSN